MLVLHDTDNNAHTVNNADEDLSTWTWCNHNGSNNHNVCAIHSVHMIGISHNYILYMHRLSFLHHILLGTTSTCLHHELSLLLKKARSNNKNTANKIHLRDNVSSMIQPPQQSQYSTGLLAYYKFHPNHSNSVIPNYRSPTGLFLVKWAVGPTQKRMRRVLQPAKPMDFFLQKHRCVHL